MSEVRTVNEHAFEQPAESGRTTAITYPGVLVMRIDVSLYFANAEAPEDRLRELAQTAEPPLHTTSQSSKPTANERAAARTGSRRLGAAAMCGGR